MFYENSKEVRDSSDLGLSLSFPFLLFLFPAEWSIGSEGEGENSFSQKTLTQNP